MTNDNLKRESIQKEINKLSLKAAEYAIPNEFDRLISRYGGSGLNAGTSYDLTVYFNEFSPQYFKQWAMINSERLINPVFRLFQSELETVYEEKNMYSDFFGNTALEKVLELFFAPGPYSFPVIGSTENLKNPKLSDMRKFFEDYYVAGNMGLVISGDFNSDEVLPVIEEYFGRIRSGVAPEKIILEPKPFEGKEGFRVKVPVPVIKGMVLAWRGVPANHKDEAALSIAMGILTNENRTGFLDKLAVDGKLLEAAAITQSFNDAGFIGVLVIPKLLLQSYTKAEELAMNELNRLKIGDFSEELFRSIKLEKERNYKLSLEDIDSRANKMVSVLSQNKSWEDYIKEIKDLETVTKQDIVDAANKYLTDNFLEIKKKTGNYPKDKLTKPGFAPIIPKNGEIKSEYARNMEKVQSLNANGRFLDFDNDAIFTKLAPKVDLYVTSNPVNNIFTLNFEYGKGTLESKLLSPMASYVSLLGTSSLTFDQLKEKLQNIGSSLNFYADPDKFVIEISGFDSRIDSTIAIVGDFIRNVKADPKKIKKIIEAKKVEQKAEKESPDMIAQALLNKVRYGDKSEYLNRLSYAQVKKLTGEELIDEFKSTLKVECSIHYCGKGSVSQIAELISKEVDINYVTIPSQSPVYRQLASVEEPVVYFIDIPKAAQSIIYGYAPGGINSNMASRHAGALFNNYFGGSMSSLIFQQIREFRSMAYRANAKYNLPSYKFKDKEGALIASLSTQCDKTTDAISILDSLIKQMPAKRERVETARQDVINEATNQYPSLRNRSTQIADLKKVGYCTDPNKSLTEDVAQMDLEQIVDFYNKNIKGRPIAYLVVGNSKKIDMQKLSSFGKIIKVKANHVVL